MSDGGYGYGSADRSHSDTQPANYDTYQDPFAQIQYDPNINLGANDPQGQPPPDFLTAVQMTLEENGIDTSKLRLDQVETFANMAWQDPLINNLWYQAVGQAGAGNSINNYLDLSSLLRTGMKGEMLDPSKSANTQLVSMAVGWLKDQGGQLTTAQQQFSDSSGSNVPVPFNKQYAQDISLDFGQGWSGETEQGTDYAMPVGTQLTTPFAGTIHLEDDGHANWGKRAFVKLSNGWTFAIGHMTSFSVQEGQQVNPGDILGYSGGDPSDPSSGMSSGPHVEVQWIDPNGAYTNPHAIMDKIWSGVSFSGIGEAGAMGKGVTIGSFPGDDPGLDNRYPGVVSAWRKYYGSPPTGPQIQGIVGGNAGQSSVGAGPSTVQTLAQQVGFTADEAKIVAAISMAESGGDPTRDNTASGAIGLMQILSSAHPDLMAKYGGVSGLHDPLKNLEAAYEIFVNAGRSFSPWESFTVGTYQQFLGQDPSVTTTGGAGLDQQQIEDSIRSQPSHIPGMSEGQYYDLRAQADQVSQSLFGHGSTDGIVAELWNKKIMNPTDIKQWYGMQSPNDILNTPAYNQIYAANQGTMWGVYGEGGADPRVAAYQYQQAQATQPASQPQATPPTPQTPAGNPIPGSGTGRF